jgi:hypothetical protein
VGALLRPNVESRRNSGTVILALRPELERISKNKQSEDGFMQKKAGCFSGTTGKSLLVSSV